ncbi:MAG: hypothetical protein K9M97_09465, partial [Akkermansiaceae bacterium]|nr:hypothetical protein [Akkermansiaceae bacterium]
MTAPAHRRPHPATRLLGAAIAVLFALPLPATCQTNPIPQIPPYSQDFGTAPFNTLPPGLAAWGGLSGGSVSSVTAASASGPTADSTVATASAAQTTGGSYGLGSGGNGRFYIQTSSNTANGANQLALALDTTGQTGITLSYDVESVSANLRTIGAVCQWRAGTSGTWATVTPETGLNPCSQSGGSPGPITSVDATLPSGADNKPVVQVRWAVWRGTEAGNSSGLAIDNITVAATSISGTLSISVDPSSVIESAGANAAT